jgi:hypothetical protein
MSADIVSTVMLTLASQMQQSVGIAVMRKRHQMDQAIVQMIDELTRTAPPPSGQGLTVDKRA